MLQVKRLLSLCSQADSGALPAARPPPTAAPAPRPEGAAAPALPSLTCSRAGRRSPWQPAAALPGTTAVPAAGSGGAGTHPSRGPAATCPRAWPLLPGPPPPATQDPPAGRGEPAALPRGGRGAALRCFPPPQDIDRGRGTQPRGGEAKERTGHCESEISQLKLSASAFFPPPLPTLSGLR